MWKAEKTLNIFLNRVFLAVSMHFSTFPQNFHHYYYYEILFISFFREEVFDFFSGGLYYEIFL